MALKLTIKPHIQEQWASLPPPQVKLITPAGPCYERALAVSQRPNLTITTAAKKKKAAAEMQTKDVNKNNAQTNRGDTKKTVKLSDTDLETNWYEILKLEKGDAATDKEIVAAYRKRCLETHPDKQKDKSDALFKKVTRAMEILTNPDARRAYDSSKIFDDSIPNPTHDFEDDKSFLDAFVPVFDRNRKWSTIPCADLSLGRAYEPDEHIDAAEIKSIRKFYDFWLAFRSWRDFSHEADLEDIDDNMDRYNKRFVQKENQRKVDALKKEETKRIRTLVDRAMKYDPRLKRFALREKQQAEEAKRKKEEEREAKMLEVVRQQEEAKAAAKKAEEEKLKADQASKDIAKTGRKQLEDFFTSKGLTDDVDTNMLFSNKVRLPNIVWFSSKATPEEIKSCVDEVLSASTATSSSSGDIPAVITFNDRLEQVERRLGRDRLGQAVSKVAAAGSQQKKVISTTKGAVAHPAETKQEVVWSTQDNADLQKLTAKYPGGTVDRWRLIATAMHGKFTEEQIVQQTTKLAAKLKPQSSGAISTTAHLSRTGDDPDDVENWTKGQQQQLEAALKELLGYKEKDKFKKVAEKVTGKTAKQCLERFKYLAALAKK